MTYSTTYLPNIGIVVELVPTALTASKVTMYVRFLVTGNLLLFLSVSESKGVEPLILIVSFAGGILGVY